LTLSAERRSKRTRAERAPNTKGVKAINRLTAQCAEDLVLTTRPSEGIRRLVEKYSKWGLDSEFTEQPVPGEKAVLHGSALVVRQR
jgi:hypothetical protein